ncbi:MAG: nicotinate-nucleotide adenylyltransferase [Puniceicoccales bacterium]|jgi:nicotinate-nucleotide adenylyltransferase|nr:nicotinate-nucleotide adenylyltransferase [Puniceicoccales bacterium]
MPHDTSTHRQKIGILGGTFDPPHLGHLILAQEAVETLSLDKVIFMPAASTPLKSNPPVAPAQNRLAFVRAATAGHRPHWEVSDWEIRQGGTSYSFTTTVHLRQQFTNAQLYWIIGADQLARLPDWHRATELCRMVNFAVAPRKESVPLPPLSPKFANVLTLIELPFRRIDISSTEIRSRLRANLPVSLFLPPAARHLIEQEPSYR